MPTALEALVVFVVFYPVITAALWIAGGVMFRLTEEAPNVRPAEPEGGWPGVTVLIPAYNEAAVIAINVQAALRCDYPRLEVLVLDDGSTDETETVAIKAAAGDTRCRVLRDPVNRGKAEQLNAGLLRAQHQLVVVTDADTHMHPHAILHLVTRMQSSPLLAAVAGAPHVTNRDGLLCAMQVLEAAAIIGLIRRTQSLTGRVGTVAGVLGLFRRDRVLAAGGYRGQMSTEDIDLTWRLLMAGWHTAYEPRALVGMQVPSSLPALWAQRKRWARGQGEVLNVHLRVLWRWRHRHLWVLALESVSSLIWVTALMCSVVLSVLNVFFGYSIGFFALGISSGVALAVVATLQLVVALWVGYRYDHWDIRAMLLGVIYPLAYWLISAGAALHEQIAAMIRGPRAKRVVWDIPREPLDRPSP